MIQVIRLDLTKVTRSFPNVLLCYNNDCKANDLKSAEDLFEVIKLIGNTVYGVFKHSQFIGFFINPTNDTIDEASVKIFRNPRACPMASRSLIKAGYLRALMLNTKHIELSTTHAGIASVLRYITPDIAIHQITSDYLLCHYEPTDDIKDKVLSKYVKGTKDEFEVLL